MEKFFKHFKVESEFVLSGDLYSDIINQLGGMELGNGIIRIIKEADLKKWNSIIDDAFPFFKNMYKLFAYDWLGRFFAVDLRNCNQPKILMFEIGTHDVLGIPSTLEQFFDNEVVESSDACLASDFFKEYLLKFEKPGYYRCAGYKVPLFGGGEDTISNLEDSDIDVYWSIMTQVWGRTR
ncbi:T6SS immunity protein Tdi1 domain-containing protein [Butyrivibrio sp. INlla14]|uniref:T6SS immunity protein Tdi1 domain-containing protein n=1 Tax=Butyrivibrio sp. INlla14 TaxID=1520808 RepID=UPI0008763520|nr:T6SS immunity protein Tdi1 domain-containing protein [Butyrivibrio sp. INlla14]SCY74918.1 protein of unknown function [Butyrivibrio sp. INlla14]